MDDKKIERMARELYQLRSKSSKEMTDERWEAIKRIFPGTVRVCREDALAFFEQDEF